MISPILKLYPSPPLEDKISEQKIKKKINDVISFRISNNNTKKSIVTSKTEIVIRKRRILVLKHFYQ